MKPRALAGPLVPREAWEARVEGVFRGAIALAHPDGLWITVLRIRGDMEPRGIWPGRAAFDALAGLVIPGGKIVFSDTVGPALTAAGVSVRTGTLETWDPRPEIAAAAAAFRAAGRAALSAGAARIEAALAEDGYSEGLHGDGPFGRRFAELRREPGFPWNLAGFGPGTTPGGMISWRAGSWAGSCGGRAGKPWRPRRGSIPRARPCPAVPCSRGPPAGCSRPTWSGPPGPWLPRYRDLRRKARNGNSLPRSGRPSATARVRAGTRCWG
ncbi:MAG: hypothetical protein MZU79_00365 [Anaerotruncus sp.]|nr:hypothetical protein [Anaerotruncus sp.]